MKTMIVLWLVLMPAEGDWQWHEVGEYDRARACEDAAWDIRGDTNVGLHLPDGSDWTAVCR